MVKQALSLCFFCFLTLFVVAQSTTATISGTVTDKNTARPLSGISVTLSPTGRGTVTDSAGNFRISRLTPGTYSLFLTGINYAPKTLNNIALTSGNENTLNIELEPAADSLAVVTVSGRRNTAVARSLETPLSVQRLTIEEIKRNPGGNFDISKVIQSLPGVGGGAGGGGFRNDIVIRGGAPSENVYYLDGIEVPVINHFGTQGSGGGPQGILNVNFIEDVKLSSSAFDARYDNALSSVLQFKQKTGNTSKVQGNVLLSATDVALTLDGPLSKKTTFLASARRSYLQLLFQAIDLPIRPNYWDFQFKITTKIDTKTTLSVLGIGAIDEFRFAAPKEASPEKLYVINANPSINQWNYTVGLSLRRLVNNGFWNLALSRNTLNNNVEKFEDNENPSPATQTLRTDSRETENKLRFDMTRNVNKWKITYGASLQYVDFNNDFFSVVRKEVRDGNGVVVQPELKVNSFTQVDFLRYGAFLQLSRRMFGERLALSAGLRADANSLANSESNPLKQLSPRVSASYAVSDAFSVNASVGTYYRLPAYTQIAYKNATPLLEQFNPAKYIRSTHYVAGVEYIPDNSLRFTIEGFYKKYSNYPVSRIDSVSLANKGSDFGSIGNEPVVQSGTGRAYGIEFFAQKKLTKNFFGILSYTFYRSEFTGLAGTYIPASWDNRHLLSITMGYKFRKNWELGLKFRYQGAAPYTDFNMPASQLNYLSQGVGVLNYAAFNTLRLPAFQSSDIRIDKKWNMRNFTVDVFVDITNWYGARTYGPPQYTFRRNDTNTAFLTTDGQPIRADGSNAIPLILSNNDIQVTPTFGFIIEF
jgi:outer membrane receptor for ferrienterochelin and colicin